MATGTENVHVAANKKDLEAKLAGGSSTLDVLLKLPKRIAQIADDAVEHFTLCAPTPG